MVAAWSQTACTAARSCVSCTPAARTCTATRRHRRCRSSGVQRALGLPECATPPEEVYALAKRRGMDFVTITDHDTIDGVLEIADRPGRVHLRGADREVPRRAAGRAHPLPRHHARRSRVAAGARRRRRGRRRVPARAARSPARSRTRSTRSRRRCSRATAAGSRSCSTSGRCATARARRSSTTRPRSTSRPTAASASAAPTTTRASTSAARGRRRPSRPAPREFLAHVRAGRVERARRAGLGRQVGARGDGAGRPRARAAATRPPHPTRARSCGWSSA